jgi:hypothetical protein
LHSILMNSNKIRSCMWSQTSFLLIDIFTPGFFILAIPVAPDASRDVVKISLLRAFERLELVQRSEVALEPFDIPFLDI